MQRKRFLRYTWGLLGAAALVIGREILRRHELRAADSACRLNCCPD